MSGDGIDPYEDALLRGLCEDGAREVAGQQSAGLSSGPSGTLADALLQQMRATDTGEPWYGPSRTSILSNITPAQAAAHPLEGSHSIWELVLHMTAWTGEVLSRLGGAPPGEPDRGDWPTPPRPTAAAWREAQSELQAANVALIEAARALPVTRWNDRVGSTSVTIGAMLVGLAQHDAYHTGQITLLAKALK